MGGSDVLDRVAELVPRIAARSSEAEHLRRIPPVTMEELHGTGLLRTLQPRRWGGAEADPRTFFTAVAAISAACGSTGWVTSVLGVHGWHLALFDPRAQSDVWGDDPAALICSSFAPTGAVTRADGGFTLDGTWSFSSGCDSCGWALLGGVVLDGAVPDFRTFLVPRSDYTIVDDWHVAGLAGSGSKSLTIEHAFVPDHRSVGAMEVFHGTSPGLTPDTSPIYRLPMPTMLGWSIAVPAIGVAQGALAAYRTHLRRRIEAYEGRPATENPFHHVRLATADSEVEAATAALRDHLGGMCDTVQTGRTPTIEQRARSRWQAARSVSRAQQAVDLLFDAAGGHALALANPLQRAFRDVHAMRSHAINDPDKAAQIFVRADLGLGDPDPTI